MIKILFLLCAILSVHLLCFAGEPLSVDDAQPLSPVFSVPLTAQNKQQSYADVLSLRMIVDGKPADVPVVVHYFVKDSQLQMIPANDLGYGLQFLVQYSVAGRLVSKAYTTPAQPAAATPVSVSAIYPLTDVIPYNQLYFHIRFNKPMVQDPHVWRYVSVINDRGETILNAWRQRAYWLDSGRLLVLMIHPGRVKSGIHYLGPLFDSGKTYLITMQGARAVDGSVLSAAYTRAYHIAAPDRHCPSVYIDTANLPHVGSIKSLTLHFSEQMDYASVWDGTRITDAHGHNLPCNIEPKPGGSDYILTPQAPWQHSNYTLILKNAVYDLAGNRLDRLFEVTDGSGISATAKETRLAFTLE